MALLRLLVFLLILPSLLTAAGEVSARGLYTGEAPLETDAVTGSAPLQNALDQVLTRLTGFTGVSLLDRLQVSADDVQLLVLSQQRIRRSRPAPDGEGAVDELFLQVDFDPRGVDALLADASLPRLGPTRPSILLWVAVEDGQGVRLDGDAALDEQLAWHARRLGLEVLRPLGDLQDLAEIQAVDIRGGFLEAAIPSAERYGAGVAAMLDLRQIGTTWSGRWFWRLDGRDASLRIQADQQESLIAQGLEALLGALVDRFGRVAGSGQVGRVQLMVEGIEDEVQFAEVVRYLDALGPVDQVQVLSARGRTMAFELHLNNAGLEDLLMIGDVLEPLARDLEGRLRARLKR